MRGKDGSGGETVMRGDGRKGCLSYYATNISIPPTVDTSPIYIVLDQHILLHYIQRTDSTIPLLHHIFDYTMYGSVQCVLRQDIQH